MASESQMMKGILEGCVLALLSHTSSYGYRVVERMRTFGFSDVAEATVYPILTRLEKKGQLSVEKRRSAIGPPRKYYALTTAGHAALAQFESNWHDTVRIVGRVLKEEDHETDQ